MVHGIGHRLSFKSYFVAVAGGVAFVWTVMFVASRSFVADSAATREAELAGYTDVAVKTRTHTLPQRFGCQGDKQATAFLLTGTKVSDGTKHDLTVCCGAWFSACVLRKE